MWTIPLSHENNSIDVTTFGPSVLLLGQEDKNVMIFNFSSYFSGQKDKSWRSVGEGVDNRWLHSYSNPLRPTPPSHWIYRQITKYNLYGRRGRLFSKLCLSFQCSKVASSAIMFEQFSFRESRMEFNSKAFDGTKLHFSANYRKILKKFT